MLEVILILITQQCNQISKIVSKLNIAILIDTISKTLVSYYQYISVLDIRIDDKYQRSVFFDCKW